MFEPLILDGTNLTLENMHDVMFLRHPVEIAPEAMECASKARQVLFDMAAQGHPVYGLNRGVGWNKDKEFDQDFFETYNRNLLNCHSLGVAPYCSTEEVRGMMLLRLSTALCGRTGISVDILKLYRDFLNYGIHPRVPHRGSIGEGDITTQSLIGLSMIGENEVEYKGEIMSATRAFELTGLKPAILGPKDGLSIVARNGQGEALTAILIYQMEQLLQLANGVYCLSLEGLNGGLQPLGERVNELRTFAGQIETAAICRSYLEGSYLEQPDPKRALQDPLTFRCHSAIQGSIVDALNFVRETLVRQVNTTDDNPCIHYENSTTSVSPNFEVTTLVLGVEMLANALSHMSRTACNRLIHLADPAFTGLSRFLTPEDVKVIAYGTIQKVFTALDAENRMLANPSSMDHMPVAGNIEDHASNLPLAVDKCMKMIDNMRYILAIEAMHGAQATDLRGDVTLGCKTSKLKATLRKEIPFLDKDRNLSRDIALAYDMILRGDLNRALED